MLPPKLGWEGTHSLRLRSPTRSSQSAGGWKGGLPEEANFPRNRRKTQTPALNNTSLAFYSCLLEKQSGGGDVKEAPALSAARAALDDNLTRLVPPPVSFSEDLYSQMPQVRPAEGVEARSVPFTRFVFCGSPPEYQSSILNQKKKSY